MKLDNQKILIGIVAITLLLFPVVAFTTGALRIVLGLLFVIFFPGYTLLSALFPKRTDLGGIERIALSLGTSIAVVPLIGLILNYTPWGIGLYPALIAITIFITVTSAVGWYRQRKLPTAERLSITLRASLPSWTGMGKLDRGLSISLVVALVVALGFLGYTIAQPTQGERFTEFYILGTDGKAEGYPKQVTLGEPFDIVIGVVNHELWPASYRVKMTINDIEKSEVNMGTLAHQEKRERKASLVPQTPGEKQRVDFYLFKNGEDEPYFNDPLHLYVDVVTFYLLNAEGKAEEYPQQVEQGEAVELIIGIINDERQPTSYRVEIKTDGTLYKEITTEALAYREKWQQKIGFVPWVQKENQQVEFWLYKSGEVEPCLETPLSIRIDAKFYPRRVIAKLPKGDRFSEFYILNTEGRTDAYPWQAKAGEPVDLIVGIVNHEYEAASYRLEIKVNDICIEEININTLNHRDKWEKGVSFTPSTQGKEQKVEFWLYKDRQREPYYKNPLYFYIDVTSP